jgi:alpha-galactosidase/6-phospho-beta-glucosidase family protein
MFMVALASSLEFKGSFLNEQPLLHRFPACGGSRFCNACSMSLKITLIGAGSVVFAKNLLGDILQFPELSDATLCLMDIDPDRLKVAEIMTNKMIAALKVRAKVVATLNQRAAIKGARYVICTIQVGGYKPGTVIDFEIPRKYGLLQTIGDTLGVGGVFRGLRTIPVMTSIARDIAEVGAPDCLLLNYTNPMAMICSAVARATGIPHVGLCHSVQGTSQQLASYAGLPYEDVTYLVAGINHMAFFLKYEYKGRDAYPLLFKLLDRPDFKKDLVRFEMMRRTGYFVTESSEHQSEYIPYFIHHGKKVIEQFEVPIDEYLRRCEGIIQTWEKTEAELLGQDGEITVNQQTHEYGSFIIHSRETNTPRIIYGNVPNTALIDNLPAEACVELPCLVDAQGIQPTHVGKLPPQLAALCMTNINVQTLTVEAALTQKREHIYHAVMLDPHTATVLTLDKIWAMCDELIAEHQKHGFLGDFAPTLPGTGRAYRGTGDRVVAEAELLLPPPGTKTNGKLEGEMVLTNPRPKPFPAELEVQCVKLGSPSSINGTSLRMKVTVPAGKTVRKKFAITKPEAMEEGFALRVSSSPDVLARDCVVYPRNVLSAGQREGAAFELKLAGFPAAAGRIAVQQKTVLIDLTVDDSKIVPARVPWEGSCIELFFADLQGRKIRQFFLVPQPGARKVKSLDQSLKPVPFKTDIRSNGSGYEIHVKIPFSEIGPEEHKGGFLFDCLVDLTALGDAHSGGRASLSGGFDSHENASRFARVEAD